MSTPDGDDYATYDDLMEMMDDRDDSNDPEFRDPDGYCEHGNYVDGCGPDYMCHWCEMGVSVAQLRAMAARKRQAQARERAETAQRYLNALLVKGVPGGDAVYFVRRLFEH